VLRLCLLCLVLAASGCGTTRESAPTPPPRAAEPQARELGWREAYPETGPQLRFRVGRLEVREDGWSVEVAIENATSISFELGARPLELQFGLALFRTGELEELENALLPSIRRAETIEPPPPDVLRAGQSWRTTLSAPGSLADGTFLRVSFGTLVAVGEPPPNMQPAVVWITDKSFRL